MTAFEQSSANLIAAAHKGDLGAFEEALSTRGAAIAELAAATPHAGEAAEFAGFEDGEIARRALDALKLRIALEVRDLGRIEVFVRSLAVPPDSHFEFHG